LDGNPATADGNWWFKVEGDWKYLAALGTGIPDPKIFPPWDVRKYIGLSNQIYRAGKLVKKWLDRWNDSTLTNNLELRTVTLYTGETVLAGNAETLVSLLYNPREERPLEEAKVGRSLGLVV
jgi:hypothetical protein